MKMHRTAELFLIAGCLVFAAQCGGGGGDTAQPTARGGVPAPAPGPGQSAVSDDLSEKDIVKVAAGSPDHTTLVKAVQAADLVDALANAGPFTVFAPTDEAFSKLPPGTLEELLKPENKAKLQDILEYHVAIGGFRTEMLRDGMVLNMANSGNVTISVRGGKILLNETAQVGGTVKASNGLVHVIDTVILPPAE
jgi:uncharacterized surface protein with fasciclin (FAS1) repeats